MSPERDKRILYCREGYRPEKHNLYLVEQRLWREQERRQGEERRRRREAWSRLKDDLGDDTQPAVFTWARCLLETFLVALWLSIIPLSYLAMELAFYFGSRHLREDEDSLSNV